MRFQRNKLESSNEKSRGVPAIETSQTSSLGEYRKSLDLLEDVFCDLPQTTGRRQTGDNQNDRQHAPYSACEILACLSQGGVNDYPQDFMQNVVNDENIDWSTSPEALLQLVHADHPYLSKSQEADDSQQTPTKSTSCSSIPDAELMHDFFLHTTNMISYRPIADFGSQPVPNTAPTLIGCPQHLPSLNIPSVSNILDQRKDAPTPNEVISVYRKDDKNSDKLEDSGNARRLISEPKIGEMKDCGSVDSNDRKTVKSAGTADLTISVSLESTNPGQSCQTSPKTGLTYMEDKNIHPMSTFTNGQDYGRTEETRKASECEGTNLKQVRKDDHEKKTRLRGQQSQNDDTSNEPCTKGVNATKEQTNADDFDSQDGTTLDQGTFTNMVQSQSLNQWTAACKAVTDKVQEESLLNCAITLMLKAWEDYLSLTFEEVRQREIQTARELNQCDDVIEMLEDKGRYVWQIIEEMEPKNFCMDILPNFTQEY